MLTKLQAIVLAMLAWLLAFSPAVAEEPQKWELVNPSGEIELFAVAPAARIASLDGKTIVLRWNGKHNGDVFLAHLSELLAKEAPTAKIIMAHELDFSVANQTQATVTSTSGDVNDAERIKNFTLSLKPDIVIASQAD